ncbi:hypothetical protein CR969_01320 [Candidatus Saccharibacteria bacterium]|nr:MAG: hypothetical protein CR969_01320 [Candidatus Saccharibacteria bacterium]
MSIGLFILLAYNIYERCGCEKAIEFARPHITRICEDDLSTKECSDLEFVCGHDLEMGLDYWLVYGNVPNSSKQFGGYVRGNSKKGFRATFLPGERLD